MLYRQIFTNNEDKTYKNRKNGTIIHFISKKEFQKIKEQEEINTEILGYVSPHKVQKVGQTSNIGNESVRDEADEYIWYTGGVKYSDVSPNTSHCGRLAGYIKVFSDDGITGYIEVRKSLVPVILFTLCMILILVGLFMGMKTLLNEDDYGGVIYTAGEDLKKAQQEELRKQIEFPGFADTTLSDNSAEMIFGNPEKNEVTFEYIIIDKDNGQTLYTTEHMAPGSGLRLNAAQLFGKGVHHVKILVNTFSVKDGKPRNNMEFNIEVTVKE